MWHKTRKKRKQAAGSLDIDISSHVYGLQRFFNGRSGCGLPTMHNMVELVGRVVVVVKCSIISLFLSTIISRAFICVILYFVLYIKIKGATKHARASSL